jgi:hypothetical protein
VSFLFNKLLIFALAVGISAAANDVYLANSSAGSDSGTSCANAKIYTYFNSSGNWSATPTGIQIGPGTTVHLCGTITTAPSVTALTTQGAGSSGNPVTILFEASAIVESPAFPVATGGIYCNHAWITIDGGTLNASHGVIRNTNNGSALGIQQDTRGIMSTNSCDNFTVQDIEVGPLFVRTEGWATGGIQTVAISARGSNSRVTRTVVHDTDTGISASGACGESNLEYDHNVITNTSHGITVGASNNCTVNAPLIHDNDIGGGAYLWDAPGNDYHHNAIFIFSDPGGGGTDALITNAQVYNNYIHGIWSRDSMYGGSHTTAYIFVNDYPPDGEVTGIKIYNNLIDIDEGDLFGPANGFIAGANTSGGSLIVNNTIRIRGSNNRGLCMKIGDEVGTVIRNNILLNCAGSMVLDVGDGTLTNNLYYGTDQEWTRPGAFGASFATWQAAGFDANSLNQQDPLLNENGTLQATSPAKAAGFNLSGLGITELNSDKRGVLRGSLWDIGAYQITTGSTSGGPRKGGGPKTKK